MIHPATVHFAIVLPVVASVFSIAYLVNRSKSLAKISTFTIFIASLAMIVAWYTGNQAGPEIYDYLSESGQHELIEHKELGLYITIALFVAALIKAVGCKMNKFAIEAFATVLLIAITVATFMQGKDGGELVYNYGMPFQAYDIQESLNDAVIEASEEENTSLKLEIFIDTIESIMPEEENQVDED